MYSKAPVLTSRDTQYFPPHSIIMQASSITLLTTVFDGAQKFVFNRSNVCSLTPTPTSIEFNEDEHKYTITAAGGDSPYTRKSVRMLYPSIMGSNIIEMNNDVSMSIYRSRHEWIARNSVISYALYSRCTLEHIPSHEPTFVSTFSLSSMLECSSTIKNVHISDRADIQLLHRSTARIHVHASPIDSFPTVNITVSRDSHLDLTLWGSFFVNINIESINTLLIRCSPFTRKNIRYMYYTDADASIDDLISLICLSRNRRDSQTTDDIK